MADIRSKYAANTANLRTAQQISQEAAQSPADQKAPPEPKTAVGLRGTIARLQEQVSEFQKVSKGEAQLKVSDIRRNPWQPRIRFNDEELQELALSIEKLGHLLHPIVVRPSPGNPGIYEIVAGERRWLAYQNLKKEDIPVRILSISDREMRLLALAENVARVNLTDYEQAKSFTSLLVDFPDVQVAASEVGISKGKAYRLLSFKTLPAYVIESLEADPTLLGSAASESLQALFNRNREKAEVIFKPIWQAYVKAPDSQVGLVASLKSALREQGATRSVVAPVREELTLKGSSVGYIKKDSKTLTISIKTQVLSEAQEKALRAQVAKLLS